MDGLILLRPWWLAGLVPLAALLIWSRRRLPDAGGWQAVMPRDMLAAMVALGALGGRPPRWQRGLAPAAIALLLLGLAGPALPRPDAPLLAQTDAVVLAIDLSPSVAQGPALAEARLAAAGLLQGLAGRPVGLILYSGEAYAIAAPTTDTAVLETQIGVLDAETMPAPGSRAAAGLGQAAALLAGLRRADLVLISDGGGVDAAAVAEADRLDRQGVRISALRLDEPAPAAPPVPHDALDRLVRGGGAVLPAAEMRQMATRLRRSGASLRDPALVALRFRDLGPFLAALAGLPLLVMLRRPR
ncbi:VWA domain-containing protein [Paracoccus spongiarum]|uniref:VWA domain-containing protein n=1 Tax=Paracoccus spongiarum TaxID=3064387 RepID=A0ABT9J9Y3_9RHOB|nr:VWA domain-containing protein [Paracoccus sp. 2205BS29-5]MDP5306614.1 VWA domain-containing protein [Paracoccus sp. 2205BS29-5]